MEHLRCIFEAILRQKQTKFWKKVQNLLFFGSKKLKKNGFRRQ